MKHIWVVVVGIILIAVGQLVAQVMPLIGRAAYQAAAAGSYSPSNYAVDLVAFNLLSGLVVVIGVLAVVVERRSRAHDSSRSAERTDGAHVASSSGADSASLA